ncbi:MAG: fumarate/nitrate reduction transcriptional regulator Fnr [Xanthomonadales bacterium]|nr:fumarate/nitrate reduction transcriptional regulator Fnr [Xanthomonadales bacterium]
MTRILQMQQLRDCRRESGRAQVACSQCSLGELCLPKNLNPEELSRFEQIVQRSRPIQSGQHIYRSGDEFESVASVRTGCFKSYTIDADGVEQVLGFYLPGEIIGFDAIHEGQHVANVVALDTSAVCSLPFASVSSMARHMPDLQQEILRVMSSRIHELERMSGDLTADQRIALFLRSLSRRFARRGYSSREFMLAMSRRDIASYLRLATETVSRVLARFQQNGMIEVDRKRVVILDMEGLERLTTSQATNH